MYRTKIPPFNIKLTLDEAGKQAFIEAARRYIGVPFIHMGRSRRGVDCVGLLVMSVYDALSIWVEIADYPEWPNPHIMRDICNKAMIPIKHNEMIPGDVALLYARGLGVVHLGVYTGKTLIHANNEIHIKKVVETTIHPDWHLRGTYTLPQYETN